MKIVVEGCCHGELDKIYDVIGQIKEREGMTVDLLICCGDFQAVRDRVDLASMAVPPKYREMGTFYKYYTGEKVAPVLTIFIGGNHEASNHLWELNYGGWVAPNIYYMGVAGVVRYGGLRIAGLSGIYKEGDYRKGHFECPPFSESTKRSVYHVRSCDIFRMKQLSGHVDIGLSHDWPQGIYHHGNKSQLLRKKSYFADEIAQTTLGNPAAMTILQHLKPQYWFSAHLHVKFAAVYHHHDNDSITKFLALDKCLPGRRFLQVLDIPTSLPSPYQLSYDTEWLAILRNTEQYMVYSQSLWLPPHPSTNSRVSFTPEYSELQEIEQLFNSDLVVPTNFTPSPYSHPPTQYSPSQHTPSDNAQPQANTQTITFCQTLGINNPFTPNFRSHNASLCSPSNSLHGNNPDEIDLCSSDDDDNEGHCHDLTNQMSEKRPYPWLDNSSGDEQEPDVSPTRQLPAVAIDNHDLAKSLNSEFESPTTKSHDIIPRSHDPATLSHDQTENPDEITLDEDDDGSLVGGVCSEESKVQISSPQIIKRRNLSIYQSQDD